jgi:hypothetical protein
VGKGRCNKSLQKPRGITTCISITKQGLTNDYLIAQAGKKKSQHKKTQSITEVRPNNLVSQGEKKRRKERTWRVASRGCLASKQGFQDNGKLMQEINLSHNGHVDCQHQAQPTGNQSC